MYSFYDIHNSPIVYNAG